YFTVSLATDVDGSSADAVLVCLDKETGKLVWHRPLTAYTYSSPVAVYNAEGKGWIIQAASNGMIELLDGMTGGVVGQLKIEGTINASPAVYKSTMVIGTQGKGTSYIYGISLK
ncbi:MAG: PQQ-binding-like beta-propeller repeat protein, partial [Clostridia bacterium]|nr:PQQ-binding-like beta-propeller repeat protein [Clostridia bacterium]